MLTANYFDDCVVLGSAVEASTLTGCVKLFFRLLGWRFAETGSKAREFAEIFQAFGISVDVSRLSENLVLFDNTTTRCDEICSALDRVLQERRLCKKEALKLRGRLQFTSGQIFGRVVKAALAAIAMHAYHAGVTG